MSTFFEIKKPIKEIRKGDIFPLKLILKDYIIDEEEDIVVGYEDNFNTRNWEQLIDIMIQELTEIKKKGIIIFNKKA